MQCAAQLSETGAVLFCTFCMNRGWYSAEGALYPRAGRGYNWLRKSAWEVVEMDARNRLACIRLYDRLKERPGLARELGVQVTFREVGSTRKDQAKAEKRGMNYD